MEIKRYIHFNKEGNQICVSQNSEELNNKEVYISKELTEDLLVNNQLGEYKYDFEKEQIIILSEKDIKDRLLMDQYKMFCSKLDIEIQNFILSKYDLFKQINLLSKQDSEEYKDYIKFRDSCIEKAKQKKKEEYKRIFEETTII